MTELERLAGYMVALSKPKWTPENWHKLLTAERIHYPGLTPEEKKDYEIIREAITGVKQ